MRSVKYLPRCRYSRQIVNKSPSDKKSFYPLKNQILNFKSQIMHATLISIKPSKTRILYVTPDPLSMCL